LKLLVRIWRDFSMLSVEVNTIPKKEEKPVKVLETKLEKKDTQPTKKEKVEKPISKNYP
jgi:hypothetical protein